MPKEYGSTCCPLNGQPLLATLFRATPVAFNFYNYEELLATTEGVASSRAIDTFILAVQLALLTYEGDR